MLDPETKLPHGVGGWVRYVSHSGTDSDIARAARISYGEGTHTVREDAELIRYLIRNHHSSPLEMVNITLHIRLPIYLMRQLMRHRTFRINEYSQRYSVAIDEMETTPHDKWRTQSSVNKQASDGYMSSEWTPAQEAIWRSRGLTSPGDYTPGQYLSTREDQLHRLIREIYLERLAFGVAREQARTCLPVCNYTEIYLNADLRNLLHYLHLRTDSHADLPHQEMAKQMASLVQEWCPIAYEAHQDYVVDSLTLSAAEVDILGHMKGDPNSVVGMEPPELRALYLQSKGLNSKSERISFIQKLKRLIGLN